MPLRAFLTPMIDVAKFKVCSSCGISKNLSKFYKSKGGLYGVHSHCSICQQKSASKWMREHPDYPAKWRSKHRGSVKESYRKWKESNPERVKEIQRNWKRRKKYGMSAEEYEILCKSQNYRCAICRGGGVLAVDHCHASGKYRGLLCLGCNKGLGFFQDSLEFLKKAVEYLESKRRF